jgi:CRP/FNR family transcriptional regulator, cyclic AMP receptor protein
MDQKLTMLAAIPLFSGLGQKDLVELGRITDEVDLPAERVIARQGDTADAFYVLIDGTVRVERDGIEIAQLGPGDFFGEIAMVARIPRTATGTTATPCRLLVMSHGQFNGLLREFPTIQTEVMRALAERVARLQPEAPH